MIGNSYTYFNNMPKMFEQLALADQPPRRVQCEMIVQGGATLQRHWEAGRAIKAIERGGWDFVILQEQSTLGETLLVEGLPRIGDPSQYFASAPVSTKPSEEAAREPSFSHSGPGRTYRRKTTTLWTMSHHQLGQGARRRRRARGPRLASGPATERPSCTLSRRSFPPGA